MSGVSLVDVMWMSAEDVCFYLGLYKAEGPGGCWKIFEKNPYIAGCDGWGVGKSGQREWGR